MSRRDWTSAFEMALLRALGWEQTPEVPLMPPSLKNALSIFPRRRSSSLLTPGYRHTPTVVPKVGNGQKTIATLSSGDAGHREKVQQSAYHFFNAMVTRPVNRKELLSNPKAMEAFLKEWKGLWGQGVFDFSVVREYNDVIAEAKAKKQQVHMARVHGLIYEKNFQLKQGDPARKFKIRGVLLGDQVGSKYGSSPLSRFGQLPSEL